ncbi:MAG TPA: DUF898 family protein [Burkholderiaceae bacterium]|nr:DUF898 family protein [Burkholderiaceae bacterium]
MRQFLIDAKRISDQLDAQDAERARRAAETAAERHFADTQPILTGNQFARPFAEGTAKPVIRPLGLAPAAPLLRAASLPSLGVTAAMANAARRGQLAAAFEFEGQTAAHVMPLAARIKGRALALVLLLAAQFGVGLGAYGSGGTVFTIGLLLIAAAAAGSAWLMLQALRSNAAATRLGAQHFRHAGTLSAALRAHGSMVAGVVLICWMQILWLAAMPGWKPMWIPTAIALAIWLATLPIGHAAMHQFRWSGLVLGRTGFSAEPGTREYYQVWALSLPAVLIAALIGWQMAGALAPDLSPTGGLRSFSAQMDFALGKPLWFALWSTAALLVLWPLAWWLYRGLVAPVLETLSLQALLGTMVVGTHPVHLRASRAELLREAAVCGAITLFSLGLLADWSRTRMTQFVLKHLELEVIDGFSWDAQESSAQVRRLGVGW